jgi:hypothetical protein
MLTFLHGFGVLVNCSEGSTIGSAISNSHLSLVLKEFLNRATSPQLFFFFLFFRNSIFFEREIKKKSFVFHKFHLLEFKEEF